MTSLRMSVWEVTYSCLSVILVISEGKIMFNERYADYFLILNKPFCCKISLLHRFNFAICAYAKVIVEPLVDIQNTRKVVVYSCFTR